MEGGNSKKDQLIEGSTLSLTPKTLKNKLFNTCASVLWLDDQIPDPQIEGYIQNLKLKNYIIIQLSANIEKSIQYLKLPRKELDFLIISGIKAKDIVEFIYKEMEITSYFKIIIFGEPEELYNKFKRVKLITNDITEVEKYISHWFFKLQRRRRFTGGKNDFIFPFEPDKKKFFKKYCRYFSKWDETKIENMEIPDIKRLRTEAGVSTEDIEEVIQAYITENPLRVYSVDTFLFEELNKKLSVQDRSTIIISFFRKINAQILKHQHLADKAGLKVYRGVGLDQRTIDSFQEVAHTNKEIIFPAFTSTSTDKDSVLTTLMDNVIFKIGFLYNPDIGIYPVSIKEYSEYADEEEYLFPMGSKFIVQNVIKDEEELIYQIDLLYNGVAYPSVIDDKSPKPLAKGKRGEQGKYRRGRGCRRRIL